MKLYLIRHGVAQDIGGEITSDAKRPLTESGWAETKLVAHALRKMGVKPDAIVSSPLVRAKQTAQIVASVLCGNENIVITEALSPGGLVSDLYKELADLKKANEICLVGHQPDMTRLAQGLLWAGQDFDMPFKKAGVCRIDIYDLPPTSPGTLKWLLTPKIATMIR